MGCAPKMGPLPYDYDIGFIKLDKDDLTGMHIDNVVAPIPIVLDLNETRLQRSEWHVIGYPGNDNPLKQGRMVEYSGPCYGVIGGILYKYEHVPRGVSGGPWILADEGSIAGCIQSVDWTTGLDYWTALSPGTCKIIEV